MRQHFKRCSCVAKRRKSPAPSLTPSDITSMQRQALSPRGTNDIAMLIMPPSPGTACAALPRSRGQDVLMRKLLRLSFASEVRLQSVTKTRTSLCAHSFCTYPLLHFSVFLLYQLLETWAVTLQPPQPLRVLLERCPYYRLSSEK